MEENFNIRLKKVMNIRNIKAIELSEKTGIPKSSISDYIKGKYEAKQKGIYKLAKVLNVSEGWLMGYDVPMERQPEIKQSGDTIYCMDFVTKKTYFITWPPHRLSYEQLYVFIDEQFVFTIFNNGAEIPYEYYHIKVEDDSINLIAPIRKNTSCSQTKHFRK